MKKKFTTYNEEEIKILKEGGKILNQILLETKDFCTEGKTTKEIDLFAEQKIISQNAIPVFKNYTPTGASYPFPACICISINEEVAHGIPSNRILKKGDIVSLDIGIRFGGLVVDSAISFGIGEVSDKEKKLLKVTEIALNLGIEKVKAGENVNEIGKVIESYVKKEGFSVVGILCGHAVGKKIHEEPYIPHIDMGYKAETLLEGMVIAIEPHISMGNGRIHLSKKDDYTYISDDGSKTAQFEHTILVTKKGFEILT
jgi:methionyl aminopeptidase